MPELDLLLPLVLILGLAGLVQGLSGFGAGLLAIPLLALFLPLATVVPLMNLLGLVIALINLPHIAHALRLQPILTLLLGYGLGAPLGLWVLSHAPAGPVLGILGLWLCAYALFALWGHGWENAWLREQRLALGAAAGALGTGFGTSGPPVILHVAAQRDWTCDQQKATLVLFFLISGAMTVLTHALGGLLTPDVLGWLPWGLPSLVLGTWTGIALYRNLGKHQYQRLTFGLILVSGLALGLRALLGGS